MLYEICSEIKNFFVADDADRIIGDFTISDNAFTPSFSMPTDYIRIVGSRKNDGVYKVSEMQLEDESFHGGVWIMSPPKDFLQLVSEIEDWQEKYGGVGGIATSPFQSESFGGYSYSLRSGGSSGSYASGAPTWQSTFAARLNRFRRLREL